MGYRQIFIKKSEKLSYKDNQLVVTKDNNETKVPLEDVNYILIEDCTTILTSRLLAEIGKNAVVIIICDEKHEPSSIMYPYNYHYKQLENLEYQLNNTKLLKNELWKLIVIAKIKNQKRILEIKTKDEYTIEKIGDFIAEVEPDDIGNREGLAAKMYFRSLFGSDFIRQFNDGVNYALNYGYTILKSCIIRHLSIYGLLTYYGIKHRSKTNNFNLAYDLVEPYRPIVDAFVFDHLEELNNNLSYEIRKELVNILNYEVIADGKRCTVEYSMDLLVKSYVKALVTGDLKLCLPELVYD